MIVTKAKNDGTKSELLIMLLIIGNVNKKNEQLSAINNHMMISDNY